MKQSVLDTLRQSVIVSVQANAGEPLHADACILAMAQTVLYGGAKGLRLANPEHIAYVREYLPDVPIIGITKPPLPLENSESQVYITPTLWTAESVAQAGANIVAMDATQRPRPNGETLIDIVSKMRDRFPNTLLMADIATIVDAEVAVQLGFDVISTTLSGYTIATKDQSEGPDFILLKTLAEALDVPIVLEGRINTPHEVTRAFDLGAFAVVIGSAITRPHLITQRFVKAIPTHTNLELVEDGELIPPGT